MRSSLHLNVIPATEEFPSTDAAVDTAAAHDAADNRHAAASQKSDRPDPITTLVAAAVTPSVGVAGIAPVGEALAGTVPPHPEPVLSKTERRSLLAVAAAAIPAGEHIPGAGPKTLDVVEAFLRTVPDEIVLGYRALLKATEAAVFLRHGKSLASLPVEDLDAFFQSAHHAGFISRMGLRALLTPLKVAHFNTQEMFDRIGCKFGVKVGQAELPRHVRERTLSSAEVPDGEVLECDVVVIGTGAGGAVAAKELAEAGLAVILLEEGRYHTRADFTGHAIEMQRKLIRDMGATVAWGNTAIPVPIGIGVGGTTTVNSGTCYRMPDRVLRKWREQHGLHHLTDDEMAGHYDRVEEVLGVAPAQAAYLGGVARVIARGCDALGYRHGPLLRNAPGCDGQGVCCFGCPTDAKRSTNVSYVPLALRAGAQLITSARAGSIVVEGGRAVGVHVTQVVGPHDKDQDKDQDRDASPKRFTVRARAVVVAAGALLTPTLLLSDRRVGRMLDRSGQLGRNLSIHPAAAAFALMPGEQVRPYDGIPQGYAIEEFHDEGLLFEGVFVPLDLAAASVTLTGPRYTHVMESFSRLASFGFLVEEKSRGRVRPGPRGRPLITYSLLDHDVAQIKRGLSILIEIFLRAGAETVLPPVKGFAEIRGEADLLRFRQAHLRARDLELTAYHPLGTARMGVDPRKSVVDAEHQAHDLPGLYLCDGSVLPTSPAVNPQVTIMALATRAARRLADRLS